jgi:RNase P subunit RPR2
MQKTEYTTEKKISTICKCCNAYLRQFKRYSLTGDYLKFTCGNCGAIVWLQLKQEDNNFKIEVSVL